MKIALSLPDGRGLGGVTTWALDLAERLAGLPNVEACLLEHATSRQPVVVEGNSPVRSIDLTPFIHPNHPRLGVDDVERFAAAYASAEPEILVPNWSWGSHAAAVAVAAQDPEHVRVIGFVHADGEDYYEWIRYYEPWIVRFVAVSSEIAARLTEELPHRSGDIVTLPYSIAQPASVQRPDRGNSPLRIIFAGRLAVAQKRILDLITMAEMLAADDVEFELRIIGSGPDEDTLRRAIDRLPSKTRSSIELERTCPPAEMPARWLEADVLVLPSDYEGTSIAMLEALAHGCVPVVTRVSGTETEIVDGETGLCFAVGDLAECVDHLSTLAGDREMLRRLSEQAVVSSRQRLGTFEYDEALMGIFRDALEKPAPSGAQGRPLLPPAQDRCDRHDLFAAVRGDREAAKKVLFRAASTRGLSWTYRAAPVAKRLVDRRAS